MAAKRSVGLVIVTHYLVPTRREALLQRRGEFTFDKDRKVRTESWRGGTQVTFHERLEVGETFPQALFRGAEEELGLNFALTLRGYESALQQIGGKNDEEEEVKTFALYLPDNSFLHQIRLSPESGGLVFAHSETSFQNLRDYDKKGIVPQDIIAMFPDEEQAVRKALSWFDGG